MRLEGKHAIVTGAAKGMGAVITLTLAREGADVVPTARDTAPLDEVAQQAQALGRRAEVVGADITDDDQVRAMVERAKAFFDGRIDILVNVAGVTGPIETPIWKLDGEDFSRVIESNIKGTFLPMKYLPSVMVVQGSGRVVNIGGTSGLRGYRYRAAYSTSKWGVRGLTRTAALEVGEHGVNVNVVCPGCRLHRSGARFESLRRGSPSIGRIKALFRNPIKYRQVIKHSWTYASTRCWPKLHP